MHGSSDDTDLSLAELKVTVRRYTLYWVPFYTVFKANALKDENSLKTALLH